MARIPYASDDTPICGRLSNRYLLTNRSRLGIFNGVIAIVMNKTIRKKLPAGRLADDPVEGRKPLGNAAVLKEPTRLLSVRVPDSFMARIEESFSYRRVYDTECPTVYTVTDHIRYLLQTGLARTSSQPALNTK